MIHQLKIETKNFDDVVEGIKPFEVRENDRDFRVGDYLALNEIAEKTCSTDIGKETGRCCLVHVTYVLTDARYVKDGYAILGIRPCAIISRDQTARLYDNDELYKVPAYGNTRMEEQTGFDSYTLDGVHTRVTLGGEK